MNNGQQKNTNLHTKMIGKKILIGLSYFNANGKLIEQTQKHGVILKCDETKIVFYNKISREEFVIPADFENLRQANPDVIYSLKSSQKKIKGIELLGSFSITQKVSKRLKKYPEVPKI